MKKGIVLSTVLTLSTSLSSPILILNNHNTANKLNSTQLLSVKNATESEIIDFDSLVKKALFVSAETIAPLVVSKNIVSISYDDLKIKDVKVDPIGEPEIVQDSYAIYMGTSDLNNQSNVVQEHKTQNFLQEVTNTISSTTTYGISLNLGMKYKFISGDINVNFSSSETNAKTTKINMVAPEEHILVPPKTHYLAKVYLGRNKAKVNLNLQAKISGKVTCLFRHDSTHREAYTIDLATAFQFIALPKGITIDSINNEVIFNGLAVAEDIAENDTFSVVLEKVN